MTETTTERQSERVSSSTNGASKSVSGAEIRLEGVTKKYFGQKIPAVDGLTLTIPAGETVMFVGPSGCGKTTSLKMINRLIEPTSGQILIDGEDSRKKNADQLRRTIGYVIQGGSLFPHQTVARNIATVPMMLGWDKSRIAKRVDELLDLVGLDPSKYRSRFPRELSGGQQQRVGVARGLAADPPVVLMDEPFGAVDPITRARLQDEMLGIQRELGKTIVAVTHDIDEAIKLGDRILILQEGAKVAQYDTPEALLSNPANDFVADFIGSGSTLKQLSLARVDDVQLTEHATCHVGDSSAEAKQRAERMGNVSTVILDDRERPIAWPWLRQIKGDRIHEGTQDNLAVLDRRATLNDALDTMLNSGHGGAVVTGDHDRYLGVIDFKSVTDHMQTMQQKAAQSRSIDAENKHVDEEGHTVDREHATDRDPEAAESGGTGADHDGESR